jgi:hypothetical protein
MYCEAISETFNPTQTGSSDMVSCVLAICT